MSGIKSTWIQLIENAVARADLDKAPQRTAMITTIRNMVDHNSTDQQIIEQLIVEVFGWSAAYTYEMCTDIWNTAPSCMPLPYPDDGMWQMPKIPQHTNRLPSRTGQLPHQCDLVIAHGGLLKVASTIDDTVVITAQDGACRVFTIDSLIGPRYINKYTSWAFRSQ